MPLKYRCRSPRCQAIINDPGYCSEHSHLANARGKARTNVPKKTAFNYGRSWRKLAIRHKMSNPFCVACAANGNPYVPVAVTDHIVAIADNPNLAMSWGNLQSLCRPCHDKASALEFAARKNGVCPREYKQAGLNLL